MIGNNRWSQENRKRRSILRFAKSTLMMGMIAACGTAFASGNHHGNNGHGNKGELEDNQCAMLAVWAKTTKLPNGASPFAGYFNTIFSNAESGVDVGDYAVVIKGELPYAGYGGWFIYPQTFEAPTGGVTLPNIVPDKNNINPFVSGNPIFAKKRNFTLIMSSAAVATENLPHKLRKLLPKDPEQARHNHIVWPAGQQEGIIMLSRMYNQFAGYDLGGTGGPTNTPWPTMKTYSIYDGRPLDCADIQPARDTIQEVTPWNTEGLVGLERVPLIIRGLIPGRPAESEGVSVPKPDPELVEFFRVPPYWTGWPGGVVPNPDRDSPDNCANYVVSRLDQDKIAMIRIPKVPRTPSADTPQNAVWDDPDAGAYNYQVVGRLRSLFEPGEPETFAIGDDEIAKDQTGGATLVVWPTTLNRFEQRDVVQYAQDNGWNLMQGNLESFSSYVHSLVLRTNGPRSDFIAGTYPTASRTGIPCFEGPDGPSLDAYGLDPVPAGTEFSQIGSEWAVTPAMWGHYAPQGVQCDAAEFLSGTCEQRLRDHIAASGGCYDNTDCSIP